MRYADRLTNPSEFHRIELAFLTGFILLFVRLNETLEIGVI